MCTELLESETGSDVGDREAPVLLPGRGGRDRCLAIRPERKKMSRSSSFSATLTSVDDSAGVQVSSRREGGSWWWRRRRCHPTAASSTWSGATAVSGFVYRRRAKLKEKRERRRRQRARRPFDDADAVAKMKTVAAQLSAELVDWSFLKAIAPVDEKNEGEVEQAVVYVHPLLKCSASLCSSNSLEMCIELLESETGSDVAVGEAPVLSPR